MSPQSEAVGLFKMYVDADDEDDKDDETEPVETLSVGRLLLLPPCKAASGAIGQPSRSVDGSRLVVNGVVAAQVDSGDGSSGTTLLHSG